MSAEVHQFPVGRAAEGIRRGAVGADAPAAVPGLAQLSRTQARALCIHEARFQLDKLERGAGDTKRLIDCVLVLDELGAPEGPEAA